MCLFVCTGGYIFTVCSIHFGDKVGNHNMFLWVPAKKMVICNRDNTVHYQTTTPIYQSPTFTHKYVT